jgi:hypothetical protein
MDPRAASIGSTASPSSQPAGRTPHAWHSTAACRAPRSPRASHRSRAWTRGPSVNLRARLTRSFAPPETRRTTPPAARAISQPGPDARHNLRARTPTSNPSTTATTPLCRRSITHGGSEPLTSPRRDSPRFVAPEADVLAGDVAGPAPAPWLHPGRERDRYRRTKAPPAERAGHRSVGKRCFAIGSHGKARTRLGDVAGARSCPTIRLPWRRSWRAAHVPCPAAQRARRRLRLPPKCGPGKRSVIASSLAFHVVLL